MQRRLDGLKTIKCKLREHPSNLKLQKLWKIKAKVLAGKWEKNWNNKACKQSQMQYKSCTEQSKHGKFMRFLLLDSFKFWKKDPVGK